MQAGTATYYSGGSVVLTAPAVPADATPHAGGYFLAPGGALYFGDAIAQNVSEVAGFLQDDTPHASAMVAGGATLIVNDAATSAHPVIPSSASPVGADYYLAPTGELYFGDALIASGVTAAVGYVQPGSSGAPRAAIIVGTAAAVYERDSEVASLPSVAPEPPPYNGGSYLYPDGRLFRMGSPVMSGDTPITDATAVHSYADGSSHLAVVTRHAPCV